MYELKPMTAGGVSSAVAKAERYRLLNEPEAAESICLDILSIEPANQTALIILLLARTDLIAFLHILRAADERATAEFVHDNIHLRDSAVGGEHVLKLLFRDIEREISDE